MRKSFILPESRPHYRRTKTFRIEHVRIELTVDLEGKRLSGECALRIAPYAAGLSSVGLDACGMSVSAVRVDGAAAPFSYDGERLTVTPPPLSLGPHDVTVAYSTSPQDGVYFIAPDEKHPEKPLQAHVAAV